MPGLSAETVERWSRIKRRLGRLSDSKLSAILDLENGRAVGSTITKISNIPNISHYPEIRHDLLVRREALEGRPLRSFEMGPQDILFSEREYKLNDQENPELVYPLHPLAEILEKSNDMPFHSNW